MDDAKPAGVPKRVRGGKKREKREMFSTERKLLAGLIV